MDKLQITPEVRELITLTAQAVCKEVFAQLKKTMPEGNSSGSEDSLNSRGAANMLKIALNTLYSKVENGELPFSRSGKRKLLFSRKELEKYISDRKGKTNQDIMNEAENYILTKKR